jgi:cysteine-rich repeat protein
VRNFGTLDVAMQLAQPCAAGMQACLASFDGFPGSGGTEQTTGLNFTATTAGTYFVAIESYFPMPMASSTIDIRFAVTQCGNGVLEGSENCDDGGTATGDGCNATCQVESGFLCEGAGAGSCAAIPMSGGDTCGGAIVVDTFPAFFANTNFNQYANDLTPATSGAVAPLVNCAATASGMGRDVVFQVVVPAGLTLTVTGSSSPDTVRHILPTCTMGSHCISSVDDPNNGPVTFTNSSGMPQTVFVVNENYATTVPTGPFSLRFSVN